MRSPNLTRDTIPPGEIRPKIVGVNVPMNDSLLLPDAADEQAEVDKRVRHSVMGISAKSAQQEYLESQQYTQPPVLDFEPKSEIINMPPTSSRVVPIPQITYSGPDIADILTDLVTGTTVEISSEDWNILGTWHQASSSLMRRGYVICFRKIPETSCVQLSASKESKNEQE